MQTPTFAPGTVITNRSRLWRVDAQEGTVLVATTIDAGQPEQQKFYIPFENIKPSRLALPSADRLGHVQTQQLLLQAYRLSLLHGSAPLVSLQRSRVIPKDYQLVPVVMALETPRVRMLLADDVGLGKTIEAGLIATELLARQMASRMLIIVPASLREQWREALDYFFHIDARIISSRHRREMERELPAGANPWEYHRCLITSVDYAKQPAIKNQILEQSWDIVIFDEAHQVAKPHQSGPDQRVRMDRWGLAQALAPHARHLLFLTATPHNGYTDSFASLLHMLDVGAVDGPQHAPQIIRSVARRHVCQRRREDVELWFQDDPTKSPFPKRDQAEVIVAPSQYEAEAIRAVQEYGERVLARAAEEERSLRLGSGQASILAHWTVMHFHKRALSSPAALRQSLRNRRKRLEDRLARRLAAQAEEGIPPDVARANVLDEDPGERLDDEEAGRRLERTLFGPGEEAIHHELEELMAVQAKAEKVTPSRDSKLQKLLDATLRERLRVYPKVIIFTRYVDTLNYLAEQISGDTRYTDVELVTIEGSMNERQRGEQFLAFERAKKAVLIATDAISEGINLQHAAAQIIHYELPWNPNRLEQRNGRVDRFGQRKPV
ncbi:MAG: DEAD/DEAH box helicase, partial [Acidobacteria bacterium]|nr:DEAD/DEAH box helicase [Acidobacteriota bacterium]